MEGFHIGHKDQSMAASLQKKTSRDCMAHYLICMTHYSISTTHYFKNFLTEKFMPLLDSALAFAITMLALSLACSAAVELIHRILKMRQAGFKYMLDQMFDQVLSKYVEPAMKKAVAETDKAYLAKVEEKALKDPVKDASAIAQLEAEAKKLIEGFDVTAELKKAKDAFVERMRANRAPMRDGPYADLTGSSTVVPENSRGLRVWGGRELTELSPVGFMERLGTMDIGTKVASAADNLDAALKDIAQKFEALGKDAADYFEGRARLISVVVAVVFAFVVHVDAVDMYTTFLQNPNTTAAVIAQSQATIAKYQSMQEVAGKPAASATSPGEAKNAPPAPPKDAAPGEAKNPPPAPPKDAAPGEAKNPPPAPPKDVASADGQNQFEEVQKAARAAADEKDKVVKKFADLGVPLGWSDDRLNAADMSIWAWTCKDLPPGQKAEYGTFRQQCKADDKAYSGLKGQQYMNIWFEVPTKLSVAFYLLLGGLLIGLGAPFWFNVVTTITNLRNTAGGAGGATGPAVQAPRLLALSASPQADNPQPATPAGAFQVAQAAKKE
jgi:hypothetical protein